MLLWCALRIKEIVSFRWGTGAFICDKPPTSSESNIQLAFKNLLNYFKTDLATSNFLLYGYFIFIKSENFKCAYFNTFVLLDSWQRVCETDDDLRHGRQNDGEDQPEERQKESGWRGRVRMWNLQRKPLRFVRKFLFLHSFESCLFISCFFRLKIVLFKSCFV